MPNIPSVHIQCGQKSYEYLSMHRCVCTCCCIWMTFGEIHYPKRSTTHCLMRAAAKIAETKRWMCNGLIVEIQLGLLLILDWCYGSRYHRCIENCFPQHNTDHSGSRSVAQLLNWIECHRCGAPLHSAWINCISVGQWFDVRILGYVCDVEHVEASEFSPPALSLLSLSHKPNTPE